MAFTDAIDVSVGDAILAAHVDNLADNTEFNRETAGATLDMDITTGDGSMLADDASPVKIKNADGTPDVMSLAYHVDAGGGNWLLLRDGNQASVTAANAEAFIDLRPVADIQGGIPA